MKTPEEIVKEAMGRYSQVVSLLNLPEAEQKRNPIYQKGGEAVLDEIRRGKEFLRSRLELLSADAVFERDFILRRYEILDRYEKILGLNREL